MERIKIGSGNIEIKWGVYDADGSEHGLEQKNLRVYMACGGYKIPVTDYSVRGNVISWVFPYYMQRKTGDYKLILIEPDPLDGLESFDVADAFRLVPQDVNSDVIVGPAHVNIRSVLAYTGFANIESIDVVESDEEGGYNTITINLIDGSSTVFHVRNGFSPFEPGTGENSAQQYNTGASADGDGSVSEGIGTQTLNEGEHAEGKYNLPLEDVSIHTVGIGSHITPMNAHLITVDGEHYILGVGGYLGTESDLTNVGDLATVIGNKVDKVEGKDLSTEDYTTAEKTKLGALPTASQLASLLDAKVDKVQGKGLSTNDFSDSYKSKLDSLPSASSLQNSLDAKVDKSSIVDNLTTNDATKVLSAKQGKVLKDAVDTKYIKPSGGIPKTDLASAVRASLDKANGAVRYDFSQVMTQEQAAQARSNIAAASKEEVNAIALKIPAAASSSNKLTDKEYVDTAIQTETATFQGNWENWGDVPEDGENYPANSPDHNDYIVIRDAGDYAPEFLQTEQYPEFSIGDIVSDADYSSLFICVQTVNYDVTPDAPIPSEDSEHEYWEPYTGSNPAYLGTWRFKYIGASGHFSKSYWKPEYQVSAEPLTPEQIAAINSGITAALVAAFGNKYDKPSGGIPKTDLASAVQNSLGKADTAVQTETHSPVNLVNLTTNDLKYENPEFTTYGTLTISPQQLNVVTTASVNATLRLTLPESILLHKSYKISFKTNRSLSEESTFCLYTIPNDWDNDGYKLLQIERVADTNTYELTFTPSVACYLRIYLRYLDLPANTPLIISDIEISESADQPYEQVPVELLHNIGAENIGGSLFGVGGSNAPTNYRGEDIQIFVKGLCIGDSLTYGGFNGPGTVAVGRDYSYPKYLSKMMNIPITKQAESGVTSDVWLDHFGNTDMSGHDFAIIQLGVNDAIQYSGWTQTSITAFTGIIDKLQNENSGIKIFVATIMPSASFVGANYDAVNDGIRDFVEGLGDENVILIDLAECGHTYDSMAYNNGHLTAYGYWRLARDYFSYISQYINEHKEEFRFVQFIDSEYVDTPVVYENSANKVDTLSGNESSTEKYPCTKAVFDAIHPASQSAEPSGGMLPNVLYDFGPLSGNMTFSINTTDVVPGVNHYYWMFDTPATAPTITWPTGITWADGAAPTISGSKHYEISLLNGVAIAMEV